VSALIALCPDTISLMRDADTLIAFAFNGFGACVRPDEAQAVLIVDANAVLT
jgi:hypothetical protein